MKQNKDAPMTETVEQWADSYIGKQFTAMYSGFTRTAVRWQIGVRKRGIWFFADDDEKTYKQIPERFKRAN